MSKISVVFEEGDNYAVSTWPEGWYVCKINNSGVSLVKTGDLAGIQRLELKGIIASGPFTGQKFSILAFSD